MKGVRVLTLLLFAAGLAAAQEREGNFNIRFEPAVVLQANAEIPFEVRIENPLHRPLTNATVTVQIETEQRTEVKVYKAPYFSEQKVYVAKPVFPFGGHWLVYVEVRRGGEFSARTIDFQVPETAGR